MTETGGQPPVSFPTKDVAVLLFLPPADAARQELPVVSVPRPAGAGRALLLLPAGTGDSTPACRPFLMNALQAAFAAYSRNQKDDGCDIPRSA